MGQPLSKRRSATQRSIRKRPRPAGDALLAWCLVLGLLGCARKEEAPFNADPDDVFAFSSHQGESAAEAVRAHVHESTSAYTAKYEDTLTTMRSHGGDAVHVIVDEYRGQEENRYFRRWLLVHTLAKVGHHDALPLLEELLLRTPPTEHGADPHHFSTLEEEGIIELAALQGVADLAHAGDGDAMALLQRAMTSTHPHIVGGAKHALDAAMHH